MNYDNKNDFRQKSIKRLKLCSKQSKIQKDKFIVKNILKIIKKEKAKNILLYIPLKMEVDTYFLLQTLRKTNCKVFVPYMVGKSLKIVPFRLPLEKKKYNIYEPKNSNVGRHFKLDLAVVPVVGIDKKFKRIGFGAGFYDRFFDTLNYKPTIVFTQLCLCKSSFVLSEPHDIKGEWIVTNKGIMRW